MYSLMDLRDGNVTQRNEDNGENLNYKELCSPLIVDEDKTNHYKYAVTSTCLY